MSLDLTKVKAGQSLKIPAANYNAWNQQLAPKRLALSAAPSKGGGGKLKTAPHPWKVRVSTVTEGDPPEPVNQILVHPGSLNGIVPTNIFAPLTITGTGVEYVVLTTTASSEAGLLSCVLSLETSQPEVSHPSPFTPGTSFTDVIAVLYDGQPYQIRNNNLNADSSEIFQETVPAPALGERQYIPWYVWFVREE